MAAQQAPPADPSTRAAELQEELDALRVEAQAAATVRMQIHPDDPYSEYTVAGVTVRREPTTVPALMAGPLLDGAQHAGVRLILTEA